MYLLNHEHHGIAPWNDRLMSEGLCGRLMHNCYRTDRYNNWRWTTPIQSSETEWTNWSFTPICVIKLREVEVFNDDERQ